MAAHLTGRRAARWRAILLLCLAPLGGTALAEASPADFPVQVWINPGIYAIHFDRSKNLRDDNIGLGAEVLLARDHGLMAGTFINSNRERSRYGAYLWRPLHWQLAGLDVSAGIAAGAFDGYPNYRNGGWFAAAMPLLAVEGKRFGVNFGIVPTIANRLDGAIAIQVKIRAW